MGKSPKELRIEFDSAWQYLSDSLDNGFINGDQYDCALDIISMAYPLETRAVNIDEGNLEEDSDPSDIGGTPMMELLFEAVEDKATFINDFRKAIKECRTWNPDEVAEEIIKSRSTND
jgi:hypothetical protein